MKAFRAPENSIGSLDAATVATIVAAATDVALVLDEDGIIQDMSFQQSDLSLELEGYGRWFGRPWSETVSAESQPKVATLLREATANVASGWRQLTHQNLRGRDVPILYSAVRLNGGSRIVALGRDMRAVASLQQKLIDAQMSMERDYAKLRFAETRYRLLFQTSVEPILIVDGATYKILETNPAADAICGAARRVAGRAFADLFETDDRQALLAYLGDVRSLGRADDIAATLVSGDSPVTISATLFRQDVSTSVLIRLSRGPAALPSPVKEGDLRLSEFMRASPDGFVLADASGHVLLANATFADMTQVAEADRLKGETLDQWIGRPGVDFDVMMANLRQHGALRLFVTALRGAQGSTLDVEISAVAIGTGKTATYGFVVRDIGRRLAAPKPSQELPRSAEQLTELIGRVPLKDLVRETTDVIEKLCIEAALELTGDNRASAAEVLGLSRQSLYVKLRRFGLADSVDDDA